MILPKKDYFILAKRHWRDNMKKISQVKLSLNEKAEVVVNADIEMNNKEDTDDIYFIMFNILHNPLRFVVATVGDFSQVLLNKGIPQAQIDEWLLTSPDKFVQSVMTDTVALFGAAQEKVRVKLDSPKNAQLSRAVISSMIQQGFYHQISHYKINGELMETKDQKIPTLDLLDDLKQMLEIVKIWDSFDLKEFMLSKGVDISQLEGLEGI